MPPEQLAISLVRYSANREAQLFQTRSCVCPICFDDVVGAKCIRLPDCGHFSCTACFTQYCKTQVWAGGFPQVCAPAAGLVLQTGSCCDAALQQVLPLQQVLRLGFRCLCRGAD